MSSGPSDTGFIALGQAPRQRKPNFGWAAALLIVGTPPLIAVIGLAALIALFSLPAKFMLPPPVFGEYTGMAVLGGFGVSTLIGLPILARLYRAGFGRGFLAVGGSILHIVGWGILIMSSLPETAVILALSLDVVLSAACIVVLWRRRRAMNAAQEQLLSQFD